MPTVGEEPWQAARPSSEACGTRSPQSAPAPTRAIRRSASIETVFIAAVRTSRVSERSPSGSAEWPVRWAPIRSPSAFA